MSIFDDLAERAWEDFSITGQVTDSVAELLLALMSAVARFGSTGPPGDDERWSPAAVTDAVNGFLAHHGTSRRLTTIRARSVDARSFRLQLEASLKNWLRDEARSTNRGHIISRIRTVMAQNEAFHAATIAGSKAWAIRSDIDELYSGRTENLFDAARRVTDVKREYWKGERRDPIASPDDLRKVLAAVLTEADALVDENLLTRLVAYRFSVNAGSDATPAPPEHDAWLPDRFTHPVEDEAAVNVAAGSLWPLLSDEVRTFLAYWDLEPADAQSALGVGRTRAYEYRAEAIETLKTLLRDHPSGREIVARLAEVARIWIETRTDEIGSSSDSDVR